MPINIKCINCGYLGVRHRHTREILEPESDLRERGYLLTQDPLTNQTIYEKYPVCFAHALNFITLLGRTPTEQATLGTITENRSCDSFTQWHPSASPKEHKEMLAERERLDWQKQREEADQAFRASEAQRADDRHKENIKLTAELHGKSQRSDWWRLVAAAVLGAFLGAGMPRLFGVSDNAKQEPVRVQLEWPKSAPAIPAPKPDKP